MSIKNQQSNLKVEQLENTKNVDLRKGKNGARSKKNKEKSKTDKQHSKMDFNYNDGDNPKFNQETINEIKKLELLKLSKPIELVLIIYSATYEIS